MRLTNEFKTMELVDYIDKYDINGFSGCPSDEQRIYAKLGQYEDIDESPEVLAKKVKALEIINKKRVCVWALDMAKNVDEYNFSLVNEIAKELTQEEYDLLKEVLL